MEKKGIKCNICDSHLFSLHRHDSKVCDCGAVAITGGADFCRISGEFKNFTIVYSKDCIHAKTEVLKRTGFSGKEIKQQVCISCGQSLGPAKIMA